MLHAVVVRCGKHRQEFLWRSRWLAVWSLSTFRRAGRYVERFRAFRSIEKNYTQRRKRRDARGSTLLDVIPHGDVCRRRVVRCRRLGWARPFLLPSHEWSGVADTWQRATLHGTARARKAPGLSVTDAQCGFDVGVASVALVPRILFRGRTARAEIAVEVKADVGGEFDRISCSVTWHLSP